MCHLPGAVAEDEDVEEEDRSEAQEIEDVDAVLPPPSDRILKEQS